MDVDGDSVFCRGRRFMFFWDATLSLKMIPTNEDTARQMNDDWKQAFHHRIVETDSRAVCYRRLYSLKNGIAESLVSYCSMYAVCGIANENVLLTGEPAAV